MEEAEQRITTTIDIRPVLERKREALFAHASQIQDSWFSKLPPEIATADVRPGELRAGYGHHRRAAAGRRPVRRPALSVPGSAWLIAWCA